jgi:hypothetical protein
MTRWATRAGCHIDRAACAWLIRRFIDPDAQFVFVADPDDVPADATAFDVRGADLSHHRDNCTFETMLERYELSDPALRQIANVVHDADLADEKYDAPEAPGLDAIVRGMSLLHDDETLLRLSAPAFDALYEYFARASRV